MREVVISDTSCLIILRKINKLDVLNKLYDKIYITQVIQNEFGEELPEWIVVKPILTNPKLKLIEKEIDQGEASAVSFALEQSNSLLILDDWKARQFAVSLNLKVTGTLGILVKAKKNGIISSVKPYLNKIKTTNFRISQELEENVLNAVNE